ncbi:MAG: helix-turn-helix transcriptional regulator [Acidobacteriota bacterium]
MWLPWASDTNARTIDDHFVSSSSRLEWLGGDGSSVPNPRDLTAEERAFVEVKLALAEALRTRRRRKNLTQTQVGKIPGSSQHRVAKMEAGDSSVTVDLPVRLCLP